MQGAKPAARERGREPKPGRRRSATPPAAGTSTGGSRTTAGSPRLARGTLLFDRYRLERELGRGGVADVWRAHDQRLDRAVAIKILHPDLLPDAGWRRRFIAEARAASGLSHPGIVPVYDVLDDPDTPAIVFQLVDGTSLADRLRRDGLIPLEAATAIAAQVAGALDHAHRAGLVHRDVKPANIVIDQDGRARLVDFGIARVVDDASAERNGGEVVGTLRYMAPEQLAGKPTDARTDLYALGLVLAEIVPRLEEAPRWLQELVARLRAPNPADRPSSAADVARALETGRLDLMGTADGAPGAGVGDAAAAVVPEIDPDAVTRSFDEPDLAVRPSPSTPISAEQLARGSAERGPAEPGPAVADPVPQSATASAFGAAAPAAASRVPAAASPAPAAALPAPAATRPSTRARTDNRPVVIAILVTAILLAGFAIGRGNLLGAASGGSPTGAPPTVSHPTPTTAPVDGGGPAAPKPHKGHGHGRG